MSAKEGVHTQIMYINEISEYSAGSHSLRFEDSELFGFVSGSLGEYTLFVFHTVYSASKSN